MSKKGDAAARVGAWFFGIWMRPGRSPPLSAHLVLFGSGLAGLGYELVWTRMLTIGLGHELVAVLSVVGAFFCGMALGAFWLHAPIARSSRPLLWYCALEGVIGLWSLGLAATLSAATRLLSTWLGTDPSWPLHQGLAFGGPFLLLLPATVAMGATLPAVERAVVQGRTKPRVVGGLYASNTLGAVAGVLVCTFVLAPRLGHVRTVAVLTAANCVCTGLAWLVLRPATARRAEARAQPAPLPTRGFPVNLTLILLITGLLGIGYEVLTVRLLSQLLGNTIYSFASVLAVYLFGTAAGAALFQRVTHRRKDAAREQLLLFALSVSCAAGVVVLATGASVLRTVVERGLTSVAAMVLAELAVAALVLLLPTLAMGATFSVFAQRASTEGYGLGRAIGINTLGASLAPVLFGTVLLPALGANRTLGLICIGYTALGSFAVTSRPKKKRRPGTKSAARPELSWAAGSVVLAAWIASGTIDLRFLDLPQGSRVVEHRDGVMGSVTVFANPSGARFLRVNNLQMGGTPSLYTDRRQAHLPLLLHPNPRRALFLGVGTGGTLAGAFDHPGLSAVGVELVPEVVAATSHFEASTGQRLSGPRIHMQVSDARRYVAASENEYDVIIADLFHPARDGAGLLYTREHFDHVKRALRTGPDSLFCQWLPLYQLDLPTLKLIVRTFLEVYPESFALLAHYGVETPMLGLVGRIHARRYPPNWYTTRVRDPELQAELERVRLGNGFELFGAYLGDGDQLRDFAGTGPFNTDDHPRVLYQAPRALSTLRQQPASVRLLALLEGTRPDPSAILSDEPGTSSGLTHERLLAYWKARDEFLKAGASIPKTSDLQRLVRLAAEPLLKVVELSSDFRPAYNPLLAMASQLAPTHPSLSYALLRRLRQANPDRREAAELLTRLETTSVR